MMHNFLHNPDLFPLKKGVYIVGGTVRDVLLGKAPLDVDIVVSENLESFSAQLARRLSSRPIHMGHPGKETIRIVSGEIVYDIVRLTGETIADNLAARDFTVNAMAYSLSESRLIDPLGGIRDLRQGIIRMVSGKSFQNDPIRLLRAFRLAAVLDFDIDPETLDGIQFYRSSLMSSAPERIKSELFKLLQNRRSYPYLCQMVSTGILFEIFPLLKDLVGCPQNEHHAFDVFHHTLSAYQHLELFFDTLPETVSEAILPVFSHLDIRQMGLIKYAILLHDIGKPRTLSRDSAGAVHFYSHGKTSAAMAREIGENLRLSNGETDFVDELIRHHNRPLHLFRLHEKRQLSSRSLVRFFMDCGQQVPAILAHAMADHRGKGRATNNGFIEFAMQTAMTYWLSFKPKKMEKPLLTGYDLIESFGLAPSPAFRTILRHVEEARLAGDIQTRSQAFSWVKTFLAGQTDSNA